MLIYERTENGVKPARIIRLDEASYYKHVYLFNNACYLTATYILDDRPSKTWVCQIDVEKADILWERSFPDPQGIEFTVFKPRRAMQATRNEIFISDINRYRIFIYDLDGQVIDSLTRQIPAWTIDTSYMRHSPVRNPNYHAKLTLDSLREFAYGQPSIRLITLLDSSTLLVTVDYPVNYVRGSIPKKHLFRHDIWKRGEGTWRLAVADAEDFTAKNDEVWDDHRMFPLAIGYFKAADGVLGQIMPYSGLTYDGKTYGKIKRELDSFLLDNDPQYAIIGFTERK